MHRLGTVRVNAEGLLQGWRQVPVDTVQMCVACNLPWLDLENHVAPQASFGSGILLSRMPDS